ncbi:MAG: TIR domain-containing protein [Anaerolineales bacterium]|nr:TIR domain-containing protein [Anaerolineales bacterium]
MSKDFDVFLSHSHADAEFVEALAKKLEDDAKLIVWLDKWVLIPGERWLPAMAKGISEAGSCAIFIGDKTPTGWFQEEIERALNRQTQDPDFGVIPVLLPGSDPGLVDNFLELRTWVDYRKGLEDQDAFRRLVFGIKGEPPGRGPDKPGRALPERGELPPPGAKLPNWRLDFNRNQVFTGREADLLALADCLLYHPIGHDVIVTPAAVAIGYGGIGKSQLAIEFCYRFGRYFNGVYWIRANQDMMIEIAACGKAMDVRPWPEDVGSQAAATLRRWSQGDPPLVVMDNIEELETAREWLHQLQNCRVLLTSRREDWPPDLGLKPHPLETLSRPQSLELLRKLAPRLKEVPDRDLEAIAERLGDLPLALDLAGRFLARRKSLSPKTYLEKLNQAPNILEHATFTTARGHSPTDHGTNLAKTFELNWETLAGKLPKKVFKTCGYCAPNTSIPYPMFRRALEAEEAEIDAAISDLQDLGLLKIGEAGPMLHPLLSEFARLKDKGQKRLPALVTATVDAANAAVNSGWPAQYLGFETHLRVMAQRAEEANLEPAGSAWNAYGRILNGIAEHAGAKAAFQRALAIDEAVFGGDHPNVAIDVNNLGSVLRDLGDLAGAKAAYERALAIDEAVFGGDHPKEAIRVNNLGAC